jgi:GNAT superfamily N-acetyltransferase
VALRNASDDFGEPIDEASEKERVAALTGPDGAHHAVLTYEPDGTVSGLSDVTWRPDRPDVAHQRFTGVLPSLRGGGRGKALKAAMLRFLRERHEAPLRVTTSNEVSRGPMIAINERLGFESRLAVVDWRIGRDELAQALAQSQ